MREILFRGKCTDTGEWVEGFYEFGYDSETETPTHYMWVVNHTEKYGEMFTVIPETVGQFTGLTDRNGKKIFEGDIVAERDYFKQKFVSNMSIISYGIFSCGCCHSVFGFSTCNKRGDAIISPNLRGDDSCAENVCVIGNRWDNPELLDPPKIMRVN